MRISSGLQNCAEISVLCISKRYCGAVLPREHIKEDSFCGGVVGGVCGVEAGLEVELREEEAAGGLSRGEFG